jgi:AcrR family transcriptional regulator
MQASYSSIVTGFRGELAVPSGPLPAGHHPLSREVVLASQRGRLLEAMAQAVAEHGYGATTVAHVVAHAGVSRKTFYEHFRDKEDCFLALYDTGIAYVLQRIIEALSQDDADQDPEVRIASGLGAFLTLLSEEPSFSRAIILEVHAAGSNALARRRATLEAFAQRYQEVNEQARAGDPTIPRLSPDIAVALVGAILEVVAIRVEDNRADTLPSLTEPLTEFVKQHVAPNGVRDR